jgi:hypothetical protein
MKKSKIVLTTILAASILASCSRKSNRRSINDWQNGNDQAYISTDGGYNYGSGNGNFWFWMYMMRGSHGYGYYPAATYTTHNHYHGFVGGASRGMSVTSSAGRAVTTRGGFGSSARSIGG